MDDRQDKAKAIAAVVSKIATSRGVPSLSANLSRVLALSGQPHATAQELAQIILQDYGLTSKTLKMVNSAFYGLGRNRVSTISRAIVMLGFSTIRDIATGMLVFEHFFAQSKRRAETMDILTKSFLSAIQAREMAIMAHYPLPEEAFICSMLHKLGKMAITVYCPKQYEAICELTNAGRSEYEASREVLGVSLPEIGRAVAKEWKLPNVIWQSMDECGEPAEPGKEMLRTITTIANSCVERLCSGEPADWGEIFGLLHKVAPLSEDGFLGLINRTAETATQMSPLMSKSLTRMGFRQRVKELKDPVVTSALDGDVEGEEEDDEAARAGAPSSGNARLLMELMADVTQALTTECSLNQVLTMILETLYRGLGFEHVVLAVLTTDRQWLQGRYGLGTSIEEFIAAFRFPVGRPGLLGDALKAGGDLIVNFQDVTDADFKQRFSPALGSSTLFIYPVAVRGKTIGCFFGHRSSARPLTPEEMQSLSILRNYGVLAIERHSNLRPAPAAGGDDPGAGITLH